MAWRQLAKQVTSAYLRRGASVGIGGVAPRIAAPARTFSPAAPPAVADEFRALGLFRSPLARQGAQGVWSGAAVRAGAPNLGVGAFPLLAGRVARGFYPQLSGHKLVKGLGTGSTLAAVMLSSTKVAYADEQQQPSQGNGIIGPRTKRQITKLLPVIKKYQLPVGLVALIALGWQNPLGLFINILLLLYSSRPNLHSIYLFLREFRHGQTHQNTGSWKEEDVLTRKVDAKDYKLFSTGMVETAEGEVLHVIGILGSWWIYRVSHGK
uniref:Uncharacterized protein n=1 Tax=Leersia perrieri TaxID=77586 RepID=A0A0D9UXA6_9ORYZ